MYIYNSFFTEKIFLQYNHLKKLVNQERLLLCEDTGRYKNAGFNNYLNTIQ